MGKTRTALNNYVEHLNENLVLFDGLEDKIRSLGKDEVPHLSEFIKGGVDVILMHLSAKFKKAGSSLKDNQNKKLSEVSDATVEKAVNQINGTCETLSSKLQKGRAEMKKDLETINNVIDVAKRNAALIKKSVEKKKSAWLISKEKKTKYKYYLELVEWIEQEIKIQEESIADIQVKFKNSKFSATESFVKAYSINVDKWTVDDLIIKADKDLATALSDYEDGSVEILKEVHKIRSELKKAGPQIKKLKEMASEADDLDGAG